MLHGGSHVVTVPLMSQPGLLSCLSSAPMSLVIKNQHFHLTHLGLPVSLRVSDPCDPLMFPALLILTVDATYVVGLSHQGSWGSVRNMGEGCLMPMRWTSTTGGDQS